MNLAEEGESCYCAVIEASYSMVRKGVCSSRDLPTDNVLQVEVLGQFLPLGSAATINNCELSTGHNGLPGSLQGTAVASAGQSHLSVPGLPGPLIS